MNYKKGITAPAIVGVIAIVLILGGVYFLSVMSKPEVDLEHNGEMVEESENMMPEDAVMEDGTMTDEMMEENFTGEILAGTDSLLLDFNQKDYQKALAEKKLVVLYFYANWCPVCIAEFPLMQSAFDKLANDDVIGFRVNYNDNQTDGDEKALAREFGVAYQHTKVILKDGERVLKSPEGWDEARYLSEINNLK